MRVHGAVTRAPAARATRDLILDAAEHRFAEYGFAGVSVREIAADVGLRNQASLYHHFRNKRALYEAVLVRGVETMVALVATGDAGAVPSADSVSAMNATLDRIMDYLIEHPHLPRLMQRAGIDDTRYLRNPVTHLLRPLYAQGLQILADTNTPWEPTTLPHVAAGLYHLIFGYFANAKLLAAVVQQEPLSPVAVARQRRFVKSAVAQLLGAHNGAPADPAPARHLRRRHAGRARSTTEL